MRICERRHPEGWTPNRTRAKVWTPSVWSSLQAVRGQPAKAWTPNTDLTMPPSSTPFTQAYTVGNPILATYPGSTVEVIEPGNVWDFAGVPTAST